MATAQLDRIVGLVAELSRRAAEGDGAVSLGALAERFGTTPEQVRRDVVALTAASEGAGTDWLSSIAIQQEGDRLSLASRGPFRRPVRFTVAELAAIQVGLAMESDPPPALSGRLAELLGDGKPAAAAPAPGAPASSLADRLAPSPVPSTAEDRLLNLVRTAMDQQRAVCIRYATSREPVAGERTIEPHDIVYHDGRWYVHAFCRRANAWRTFRADRVLGATIEDTRFERREDFPLFDRDDVFHAPDVDQVDVRFSPAIARWIRERYPDAREDGDGAVIVTYHVADPQWLVQTVLQYGEEAEVIAPEDYRRAMRASLP